MRLREIEARIAKIQAARNANPLAGLSEEDLNGEIIRLLNKLTDGFPTYDAMIAEVEATPEPGMSECARLMRWYLHDYTPRQRPAAR